MESADFTEYNLRCNIQWNLVISIKTRLSQAAEAATYLWDKIIFFKWLFKLGSPTFAHRQPQNKEPCILKLCCIRVLPWKRAKNIEEWVDFWDQFIKLHFRYKDMCSVQIRNKMRPAKKCRPVAPLAWPVDHRWPLSFRISEIVKSCVIACGRRSCRGGQGRVGSPSPIRYYSLFTCPPPVRLYKWSL